jgi:hypothetical protein
VQSLAGFRDAYRARRCILPVDAFFGWRAVRGERAKQPYAIAMKDGSPFGIAGVWENWKDPRSGDWVRTFAILTTDANELGRVPKYWVHAVGCHHPRKRMIQDPRPPMYRSGSDAWMPACAGMTIERLAQIDRNTH